MPGPDQIQQQTFARDAMFGRMGYATGRMVEKFPFKLTEVPRTAWMEKMDAMVVSIQQKLTEGKEVVLTAHGKELTRFQPGDGAVIAACLRQTANDTFALLEAALRPYTDVGAWGVTEQHRWRAGEAYRPFPALRELTAAVDSRPVTWGAVQAACEVLPGIGPAAMRIALEAARDAMAAGR